MALATTRLASYYDLAVLLTSFQATMKPPRIRTSVGIEHSVRAGRELIVWRRSSYLTTTTTTMLEGGANMKKVEKGQAGYNIKHRFHSSSTLPTTSDLRVKR